MLNTSHVQFFLKWRITRFLGNGSSQFRGWGWSFLLRNDLTMVFLNDPLQILLFKGIYRDIRSGLVSRRVWRFPHLLILLMQDHHHISLITPSVHSLSGMSIHKMHIVIFFLSVVNHHHHIAVMLLKFCIHRIHLPVLWESFLLLSHTKQVFIILIPYHCIAIFQSISHYSHIFIHENWLGADWWVEEVIMEIFAELFVVLISNCCKC